MSVFGGAASAQPIGSVIELNRDAYGTPPGGQADLLGLGGDVVSDELVQTLAQASTRIRFLDDSDLRVGESSMIVLDRLVYDPDQGTGEFVLGIAVGTMRFVSGDLPPEQVVIETPVAVIGIRGT
ncbi:MAG: FecR domain-containing protein, partial [Alphaproteobacteria bacterium]|nr:FecR domain-containing protein [Alphaproteobacteria bacterium]